MKTTTPQAETTERATLLERVAAAICKARVGASPDACGGGAIGWHAIGEPGKCPECIAEAKEAINDAR